MPTQYTRRPPSKFHVLFEFSINSSIFSSFSCDFINFRFMAGSQLYERLLTPGFRRSIWNFDISFEWILSVSNIFDESPFKMIVARDYTLIHSDLNIYLLFSIEKNRHRRDECGLHLRFFRWDFRQKPHFSGLKTLFFIDCVVSYRFF